MENTALLHIKNLSKKFNSGSGVIQALNDFSFQLKTGQSVSVIGNNASGKSTLLKIIAGIYRQSSGEVLFKGEPLFKDDTSAKSKIGYQPEDVRVPDLMTIDEYVEFIMGVKKAYVPTNLDEKKELYDIFELHDKKELYFNEASLGNRKKAALAGALVMSPELIILDEPTNGLDLKTQTRLYELLKVRLNHGASVLAATHQPDFIRETETASSICMKGGVGRVIHGSEEIFQAISVLRKET